MKTESSCNPGNVTIESIAPSCNIKGKKEREEAKKWLRENFYVHCSKINEISTGYELLFENPSDEFKKVILDVFYQETRCCPSFTLGLIFEPDGRKVRYQYYGSEAIKKEMEEAFRFMELID